MNEIGYILFGMWLGALPVFMFFKGFALLEKLLKIKTINKNIKVHPRSVQSGNKVCVECKEYFNERGFDRCILCLAKIYTKLLGEE